MKKEIPLPIIVTFEDHPYQFNTITELETEIEVVTKEIEYYLSAAKPLKKYLVKLSKIYKIL